MVQIILTIDKVTVGYFRVFISHMVQIIRRNYKLFIKFAHLYIPHGSDNTQAKFLKVWPLFDFFISHMVQIIH